MKTILFLVVLTIFCAESEAKAQTEDPASSPCEFLELASVADSVASAFNSRQFVFMGSTHGGKKLHDFLLCLLSRSSFQQHSVDVLVEWANPVHQELMDRYLLAFDQVPEDSLQQIWFDTARPQLWATLPQIPEFFQVVRKINTRLNPQNRIRVIGGNQPVDWSAAQSVEDIASKPFKTNWAAHVITEHYAPDPKRRLLVVYGDGHIHYEGGSLMSDVLSKINRDKLFVVGTIKELNNGEEEQVDRLGDKSWPFFVSENEFPPSGPYPDDLFYARNEPLSRYVDAVAYLGPKPDTNLTGKIQLTDAQQAELMRRDSLEGGFELRFKYKDRWFQEHPNDIPPKPH